MRCLHPDARVLPAPSDREAAPPLIFLPALGFGGHSFADVAARMQFCCERILIDLPGIRESAPVMSVEPEDILDAVDAALEKIGERPAILVGHSIGGAIAVRLLARQRRRFLALALVDAA